MTKPTRLIYKYLSSILFKASINCRYPLSKSFIAWSVRLDIFRGGKFDISNVVGIREYCDILVYPGGLLDIGKNTRIMPQCEIVVSQDAILRIGSNCYIGRSCNIRCNEKIIIEDDCRLGQFVSLIGGQYDVLNHRNPPGQSDFITAPITIGKGVWLGAGSIVLPGIKIGEGAVLGAGAVATKDIPAFSIAVGNPARVIRYRG